MRIIVLGGTGLTGPFAVRRFLEAGHQVTVYHRGRHSAAFPAGVRELQGDFASLPDELRRPAPDVVVHMWAMTEADARSFVSFFRGTAGRAVVISSADVYLAYGRLLRLESGPPGAIPITEDAPLRTTRYPYRDTLPPGNPDWMRFYDKILVERAVTGIDNLPATVLRYPAVYGPGDSYHRFGEWVRQMERGLEVALHASYANWRWTHGYVEDVAEAIVLAATDRRAAGRVYNVGEADTPTMAQRIEELGRVLDWQGRIVPAPVPAQPYDFANHLVVDTSRIRRELGYVERVSREECLERTIRWERAS
jgi:nucleoside-diphosphate-sugar epimerase